MLKQMHLHPMHAALQFDGPLEQDRDFLGHGLINNRASSLLSSKFLCQGRGVGPSYVMLHQRSYPKKSFIFSGKFEPEIRARTTCRSFERLEPLK